MQNFPIIPGDREKKRQTKVCRFPLAVDGGDPLIAERVDLLAEKVLESEQAGGNEGKLHKESLSEAGLSSVSFFGRYCSKITVSKP